jgi:predicted DNA-binding protein (MmcQ/YjbR family)
MPKDPTQNFRKLIAKLPDVTETIACKGTAIEQSSFKTNKKSFFFLQAKDGGVIMRLKLEKSMPAALAEEKKTPKRVEVGKNNWVTIRLAAGERPPAGLSAWVRESHALSASGKTGIPKEGVKKVAKKATKKTAKKTTKKTAKKTTKKR